MIFFILFYLVYTYIYQIEVMMIFGWQNNIIGEYNWLDLLVKSPH
jgi:hypothetical protein